MYITGPEMLLRQSSDLQSNERVNTSFGDDTGDALETHEWRFVRTLNGIPLCCTNWHPISNMLQLPVFTLQFPFQSYAFRWLLNYIFMHEVTHIIFCDSA